MARVRAEFRVEIYVADPDDPVLGRRPCLVAGCDRSRTAFGLCSGHDQRWRTRGCPDLAEFIVDPGPAVNGRRELTHCTVPGCRYGSSGFGLCTRHRLVWLREGRPDPKPWAAQAPIVGPPTTADCLLPFCSVWTENPKHQFCKSHETRWAQLGRPGAEEYIAHCLRSGKARIDFRGMTPQLTLELQYAVQCRHDQATITAPPPVVAWTIALARRAEVSSLLDLPPQRWHELAGGKQGQYQRFLDYDLIVTVAEGSVPDPVASISADLIVDATVSRSITTYLDTLVGAEREAIIAQIATDASSGTLGIANVCAADPTLTPSDIDERAGRSVLADGGLELYHPLWQEAADGDELIPTRGCSVPTFHGSAADLAAVAATLVNMIGLHLQQPEAVVSGTHLIALPHAPSGPRHRFVPVSAADTSSPKPPAARDSG